MLKDKFEEEKWNALSCDLKYAIAVKMLENPYFSSVLKETGMSRRDAHIGQNRLVDRYIIDGYGELKKVENRWCRVPKIIDKTTNEFLDVLIKEMSL